MSKKSKRQVSYGTKNNASILTRDEFNPDYSNTKRELKRIGILAGSFIALLVVLSFFQNSILKLFIK
jgi:ribosome assembly protein YihI (activator of Der GTPase)